MILGTEGHVDHGKTSLVKALTAVVFLPGSPLDKVGETLRTVPSDSRDAAPRGPR